MKTQWKKEWFFLAVLIILFLLSLFWLGPKYANVSSHVADIQFLDHRVNDVLGLAAGSTGISALISMIPGGVGEPIAEQLMDFNVYYLIIVCGIFLEKYLLTITAQVTFYALIPCACVLGAMFLFTQKDFFMKIGIKIFLFGLILIHLIPVSVTISQTIMDTAEVSIQETIHEADQFIQKEDKNLWDKIKNGFNLTVEKAKNITGNFIEQIAVLIITSCFIPILVFLGFLWTAKVILGIPIPSLKLKEKNRDEVIQLRSSRHGKN